ACFLASRNRVCSFVFAIMGFCLHCSVLNPCYLMNCQACKNRSLQRVLFEKSFHMHFFSRADNSSEKMCSADLDPVSVVLMPRTHRWLPPIRLRRTSEHRAILPVSVAWFCLTQGLPQCPWLLQSVCLYPYVCLCSCAFAWPRRQAFP